MAKTMPRNVNLIVPDPESWEFLGKSRWNGVSKKNIELREKASVYLKKVTDFSQPVKMTNVTVTLE